MTGAACIICGDHAWYHFQNRTHKTGPYCPMHNKELKGFLEMKKNELVQEHWDGWVNEWLLSKMVTLGTIIPFVGKKIGTAYLADQNKCPTCGSEKSDQCGPCYNIRRCSKCKITFTFPHSYDDKKEIEQNE